jgi:hypothetical protein
MDKNERLKMAIIAGAAAALEYKERNPRATESEVMGFVTKRTVKIIRDLDED